MSRNFYVLAASLMLFAVVSCGMAFVPSSFQSGLPMNGSLWKTTSLFLLLGGLCSAMIGMVGNLYEQVDRHHELRRRAGRAHRRFRRPSSGGM